MVRLRAAGRAIVALLALALAACQPAPLPPPAASLEAPRPTPRPTLPDRPEPGSGGRMPCIDGCAMSNGDPHLVTVDGTGYDFQAAGEFVLLRSPNGAVEIQARQEPYPDTNNVTINTAVALRVDGQRVGVYFDRDSGMWATLDGELLDGVDATLIGDGTITPLQGNGYEIALPDGTHVYALSVGLYGINLLVEPSAELRAAGQGALASVPPDSMGVPALPDGSALPPAVDGGAYYESLYVRFADAWRVTSESSLFDYEEGQTTTDFTIQSYPREDDLIGLEDLTPAQRAAGEAACASISDPLLHAHCVFDVGITADAGFADPYLSTLTLVESGALPETGARARLVNLYLADGQPADVDVYAYSWSEEEMGEVASLVASVPYGTVSDWFNPGLIDSPFGEPYSRLEFYRRGDQSNRLMEFSEVGPGTQTTIAIWTEEGISGEPSAWLQAIHQKHPEFPVQGAPPAAGMLVTRNVGLLAGEDDPPLLYASVGDGCLTSVFEEPGGGGPQPIGNDLLLPLGSHTLTVHTAPEFEVPECDTEPAGPGTPITVSDGDRFMLYLYALPGQQEISQLLIPFGR